MNIKARFLGLGALALVCTVAPAQVIATLPAACESFNADPGGVPAQITLCNTSMSTAFVATSAFTATHVDLFVSVNNVPEFMMSLANTTAGTGTAPVNVATNTSFFAGWNTTALSAPIAFAAGDIGAVNVMPIPGGLPDTLIHLYVNPAGTTPLGMTRSCGTPCTVLGPPCVPGTTLQTLMLKIRGPGCGIPAVTTHGGLGCGAPPGGSPPWLFGGAAVVGQQLFGVQLSFASPPGATAFLFVAEGSITAGAPVEGGHPCRVYLNLASFATLNAFGYEPLLALTTNASSQVWFGMPIPNDAALAGFDFTLQAVIIDPSGVPLQTVPGVSMKASNALHIQIGG